MKIADVVPTPDLVEQMIRDRPLCWTWAAFASVLFQRWSALEERKVMQVLSTPVTPAGVLLTGRDVAWFVSERIRAAEAAMIRFAEVLDDPAFEAAFGAPAREDAADAEAIVAFAHRLGDCYQDLLAAAEECRIWLPPDEFADLLDDAVLLLNGLVRDMAGFVNDVLLRLESLQRLAVRGRLPAAFEPLCLDLTANRRLLASIQHRLEQLG